MIVVGVVIETIPGSIGAVSSRLSKVSGLRMEGDDGERRIAGVWEVEDAAELDRAGQDLVRDDEGILGVFPVYVGDDEDQ